ncbi:N-acetylglucosamine kinase [Plantibacter sp. Mn2098]|uniref:N-acetylglucosamine kinase n=1 Tax=Plantibacter sp. Mn2098 TaxID=3395266 RepID=UPI003BCB22AB
MTMQIILALDAGGTSTRAAVLDDEGRCLGSGRARGGNPTSSGVDAASTHILAAAADALAAAAGAVSAAGAASDAVVGPDSLVVITQAGQVVPEYRRRLVDGFAALGIPRVIIESDLLGMYGSGTPGPSGSVLVGGTGSVAGRIEDGRLVHGVGGAGWLLGDDGSGFWIARRIVRAVAAELDGLGPSTALTPLLSETLGLPAEPSGAAALPTTPRTSSHALRPAALTALIDQVYGAPPIAIARFAPLAFAARGDQVAEQIVADAVGKIAELLVAVHRGGADSPVILGGSVLVGGLLQHSAETRTRLAEASGGAELVPVADGLVGAAIMGLRAAGIHVDRARFELVHTTVATAPGASAPAVQTPTVDAQATRPAASVLPRTS